MNEQVVQHYHVRRSSPHCRMWVTFSSGKEKDDKPKRACYRQAIYECILFIIASTFCLAAQKGEFQTFEKFLGTPEILEIVSFLFFSLQTLLPR